MLNITTKMLWMYILQFVFSVFLFYIYFIFIRLTIFLFNFSMLGLVKKNNHIFFYFNVVFCRFSQQQTYTEFYGSQFPSQFGAASFDEFVDSTTSFADTDIHLQQGNKIWDLVGFTPSRVYFWRIFTCFFAYL